MRTRNIDLAAYLHLSGVDPDVVSFNTHYRVNEFEYQESEMLRALLSAFEHGAMVPVKQFAEARNTMKALAPRKGKRVQHHQAAIRRAVGS